MTRKMIMTGGLILVATGSSAQLLVWLEGGWYSLPLGVMHVVCIEIISPYHSHHDDLLSFVTSLQTMLTLMHELCFKDRHFRYPVKMVVQVVLLALNLLMIVE